MLSRVAAVKAPNKHNRRRVTGSSGRRREGRESERQRSNMSRHLFYSAMLLLLVVMMCCGSGAAGVEEQPADPQFKWKGITGDEKLDSLGAPSVLKVGNDVFAVAEAQWKKDDVSFTGISSQLLTKKTANTPEELFSDALKETRVLEEGASKDANKRVDVSRPTTAVKGSDIYMLAGVYTNKVAASGQNAKPDSAQLGLLLVKGSVSVDGNKKKIDWKDTESPPQGLFGTQLDFWTRLIGSGGSGVKMEDGTLVFPVEGTKTAEGSEEDVKTVSLIVYFPDNASWTLSKGMSDGGCSDPSVVEWEKDKKLMMMTACNDGRRRVYESGDKGEEWTEALGTLSRVWGNKHEGNVKSVGSGLITAKIDGVEDNRNVMLVTLPVYAEKGNEKGKLHLWLTDNTHIADIGPVSDDDAATSSLLYKSGKSGDKKEELIALYEKRKGNDVKPSPGMISVLLTEQLQRVKKVLATWKKVDERVSQLCTSLIAAKNRPTGNACSADKITDGLVGFLSGNFSDGIWKEEYLGVNATIAENDGAEQVDSGVKFTGRGAGAQWPVGRQGENQLYHFANYKFTLVATVSIHNVPEGNTPIPLMGVRAGSNGENKLMEFSYSSEKKWQVLCSDENPKELGSIGETDTTQHVVILLRNGNQGTAYVDGQRVGNAQCALGNGESNDISRFYIGGDGGSAENKENREGVSVTVTNVLLYNRPLDDSEIRVLNPNKANIQVQVERPVEGDAIQSSPGGGKEEQGQSLESSRADGVSASTVSSAKTSSGGEGSATQLVKEESSDGSKNVGGASSPGSD
ncbi:hypothetical protein ECC02_013825, partial [Trypanosoma cruzi]